MSALKLQAKIRIAVGMLVAMPLLPAGFSSAQTALQEASGTVTEYDSVSAAYKALKSKPGVVFGVVNGWEVATDKAKLTIWSFAPHDYAAYPALVKRQVIEEKGGQVSIQMIVQCEASKSACDELVRTFSRMNGFSLPKQPNVS